MPRAKTHTALRKAHKMQLTAFALLLLYLLGSSPALLFHHHEAEVAEYANATPCEKTIYFAHADADCHHSFHFTKALEKCFLCDNHTVSPHALPIFFSADFILDSGQNHNEVAQSIFTQTPSCFSNRGPPSVSSPMA